MNQMLLQELHASLGAHFTELGGVPVVNDYGDWLAEHAALRAGAGVLDLSFRSRFCLVGGDRVRFLHGQVTNDVKRLRPGQGCYAAITNAKGRMEGDANIFCLADELLLDLEPGLGEKISQRFERFIVADDVQVVDAAPLYGLLSVQGPRAEAVVAALGVFAEIPGQALDSTKMADATLGEIYLANHARLVVGSGFDLFVPNASLGVVADQLIAAAKTQGGGACGWQAWETARIEAGIPRYGADMDETSLPLECGLEARAITYTKGCYLGQEVINRIHSVGHVNRALAGLRLLDQGGELPQPGDKLFQAGKAVGHVTSAVRSPLVKAGIALGYVRREAHQEGREVAVKTAHGEVAARVTALPFAAAGL